MREQQMTYASKVDSWIGIVLALIPAGLLLEAVLLRSLVAGVVAASVPVVYALLVFPVNYELGPAALTVRSGVLRDVRPSQCWLSAPRSRSTASRSSMAAPTCPVQ
jgi:hypothetical protein